MPMQARHAEVVMIGTPLDGRGGMSSVVAAYRDSGFFDAQHVRYLSTVADGGPIMKLAAAASAFLQLLSLLIFRRVRLLHIHVASGISFWRKSAFCMLAFLFRRPVILHVHGGNFPAFYAATGRLGRAVIRNVLSRASRVAVLSAQWISRMREIESDITCVIFDNPVAEWPVGKRKDSTSIRFLFLGRLERDKGIYELVEALSQLPKDCHLILGGDGDLAAVRELAESLGVIERIEFLGWVTGDTKRLAFEQADVFVLPSHIEGLPVAMLEAMHCSLPVIICPVGSIPEVVRDGQEALFVQPGDTTKLAIVMTRLATDAELRRSLGSRGRNSFTSRFTMANVGPKIAAVYDEISCDATKNMRGSKWA